MMGFRHFTENNRGNRDHREDYEDSTDNAVNIARERYARGEISREEFKEIVDNLKRDNY